MTTTVRRRNEVKKEVTTPQRSQDVGVEPNASVAVTAAMLRYDRDTEQPFCTCGKPSEVGFGFDPQMGLYVHADVRCWKPSKAMYALALQTGTLEGVLDPKEKEEDGTSTRSTDRADRGDVQPRRSRR